jgi:hypothetical protein
MARPWSSKTADRSCGRRGGVRARVLPHSPHVGEHARACLLDHAAELHSRSVSRWQDEIFSRIERNTADRTAPQTLQLGDRTVHLPTLLDTIRFKASHDDPRLQIAMYWLGSRLTYTK